MDAVVWEASGSPWRGSGWGAPIVTRLRAMGWRTRVVPWGDPGIAHRGRHGVLHVFSGGGEPVGSASPEALDRLGAVEAAVLAAAEDQASVLGICLGAQMIAAAVSGALPVAAGAGGEAGVTTVRSVCPGVGDLVVATAHVEEVPRRFLGGDGVTHLWANDATTVQGFRLGQRTVGVQFHPELSGVEVGRAGRGFRRTFGARPVWGESDAVDPIVNLGTVLALTGADHLTVTPRAPATPEPA